MLYSPKILSVLFFCLIILPIQAQFKFGIHGGLGSSNYTGSDFSDDNKPKLGVVGGLYFERELNLTIAIGTEINYEQKGTFYNYSPRIAINVAPDSRLDYFSVPLYAKAYIGYNAYYYFYAGVSGAYLSYSSLAVSVTENGYPITTETFFDYEFRKIDAAILAGFGVNFRELILDLRYQHGLIDVYKGNHVPSIKNMFFSVTLGYSLYKKKKEYCLNPMRRIK
jgi:hypothetical protein